MLGGPAAAGFGVTRVISGVLGSLAGTTAAAFARIPWKKETGVNALSAAPVQGDADHSPCDEEYGWCTGPSEQ